MAFKIAFNNFNSTAALEGSFEPSNSRKSAIRTMRKAFRQFIASVSVDLFDVRQVFT